MKVEDAPSEAQSIDIEKWEKERVKEKDEVEVSKVKDEVEPEVKKIK